MAENTFVTPSKTDIIGVWLVNMDRSMIKYKKDFINQDFTSMAAMKFFTNEDFEGFNTQPSSVHRRMILNAVAKLQTPNSKLGWETLADCGPRQTSTSEALRRSLSPKRLPFQSDKSSFKYKSPIELMLTEVEVRIRLFTCNFHPTSKCLR